MPTETRTLLAERPVPPAPAVVPVALAAPAATAAPVSDTNPAPAHDALLAGVGAGLDTLQTGGPSPSGTGPARLARAALTRVGPPLAAIAVLIGVWQVAVWAQVQPSWVLPSPAQVWQALAATASSGTLTTALATTLERGIVAFLVAVGIATPLAIAIARVRWVRVTFGPLVTGLQVLPSVAWVPVAILWFGLSNATVYFVVLMSSVPAIVNGIVAGVDQVPPLLRSVGRVLGAGRLAMALHIVLPAALPGYLAGLKQGWAWAWRALLVSELIAVGGAIGFGLGTLLNQGRTFADMPLVIASTLVILVVGIVIELLVFAPLERLILTRRGLAR